MENAKERLLEIKKRESLYRIMEDSFIYQGRTEGYYKIGSMLLTNCDEFMNYKIIAKIKGEKIQDVDISFVKQLRLELKEKGHKDIFNV